MVNFKDGLNLIRVASLFGLRPTSEFYLRLQQKYVTSVPLHKQLALNMFRTNLRPLIFQRLASAFQSFASGEPRLDRRARYVLFCFFN